MPVLKACPIIVRPSSARFDILAFRHPLAGKQLVKGTIEHGEHVIAAALRELEEESGIVAYFADGPVWESHVISPGQIWHFVTLEAEALPDHFTHWATDDGGHLFSFFWQPLTEKPDADWHPIFLRALNEIAERFGAG